MGGLAALTLVAYGRIWRLGLVYDDLNWLWPALTVGEGRQAVALAPFVLAHAIGGGLPWAFHGLILALHLLNGLVLWSLMRRWLSIEARVLTLTLFWLHPLQVEAVAYATGGLEVLLTTYVLLAWLTSRGSALWRCLALLCLGLGASLKVSALPILVIVPLALAWTRGKALWPRVVVFGAFGGALAWMTGYLRFASLETRGHDLTTFAVTLCRYLAFVIVPRGFSIEHDWSVPLFVGVLAVAAILSAGILAYRARADWSAPWYAWLWIVGLLAPRVIAPSAPPLTEHHTYLAFIAIWLCAGSLIDRMRNHAPVWSWSHA